MSMLAASDTLDNGQKVTFHFKVSDYEPGSWDDSTVIAWLGNDPDIQSIQVSSQATGIAEIAFQISAVYVGPGGSNTVANVAQNIAQIIKANGGMLWSTPALQYAESGKATQSPGLVCGTLGLCSSTSGADNLATSLKWVGIGAIALLLAVVVIRI